jgi:hypothetical protein
VKAEARVKGGTFTKNNAAFGGAIYSEHGQISISRANFTRNTAGLSAGAVWGGSVYLEGSTFKGNDAAYFGGALVAESLLNVSRSTFASNSARLAGAVSVGFQNLSSAGCDNTVGVSVTGSTFSKNSAIDESTGYTGVGAMLIACPDRLLLRGNLIQGNTSFGYLTPISVGGVLVYTDLSTGLMNIPLQISGNRFIGNTGMAGGGFAYFASCASTAPSIAMLRANTWKSNVGIDSALYPYYYPGWPYQHVNSDYMSFGTSQGDCLDISQVFR